MRISDWSSDVCSSDLTVGDSLIDTVSLPWVTAAVPTRNAPLMTTVPLREFPINFAVGSARPPSRFSTSESSPMLTFPPPPARNDTPPPSSPVSAPRHRKRLFASCTPLAAVYYHLH